MHLGPLSCPCRKPFGGLEARLKAGSPPTVPMIAVCGGSGSVSGPVLPQTAIMDSGRCLVATCRMANPKDLRREDHLVAHMEPRGPQMRPFGPRSLKVIRSHALLGPECMAAYHKRRSCRGALSTPPLETSRQARSHPEQRQVHVVLPICSPEWLSRVFRLGNFAF